MKQLKILVIACFITSVISACSNESKMKQNTYNFELTAKDINVNDPHTQANYEQVELTHLNWTANINFDREVIEATATWSINRKQATDFLILDTKNLDINSVLLNNDEKTQFELLEKHEQFGRALKIEIFENTETVTINYETTKNSGALQWLSPQQTADKTDPFLFTQSQAILARTWLPCMDGPGFRFTYDAQVTVPNGLLALMSAENPKEKNDTGEYEFSMEQPVPSYLFALSVGNLEYQKIGKKSGVYAEPSVVEKAAKEFEDLPKMIQAAEDLYGPYRWDEYDVIVLPPSFPFGGMENPRLTFATPTILAGDKSLTSLVAHELAHSWSGNLVTNSNWEDIWLNEGFTVYFEQRIMEALYGREYSEMLASLSYQGLLEEIEELPKEDTRLKVDLENRDPDEGLTSIPYDKGYLFLRQIEETIGRDNFDNFLRSYFDTYGFKVMNTATFIELLEDELIQDNEEVANELTIQEWIHSAGLPENHPKPSSDKFEEIDAALSNFDVHNYEFLSEKWSSHEWQHFIESLPRDLGTEKMSELDKAFDLINSTNSEIQFDWYMLAIENNYAKAFPAIKEFLISVGRRKFLTPLYKKMVETGKRSMAESIYQEARPNYHSVSFNTIDEVLNWKK